MKVKFNTEDNTYDISSFYIEDGILYLIGADIPKLENSEIAIYYNETEESPSIIYNDFSKIYDSSDEFVAYVTDEDLYTTFLLYDNDNFVYNQLTIVGIPNLPDAYKGFSYKSGYSKECRFPEKLNIFDENGINLYKIDNGKLVETTINDKLTIKTRNEIICKEQESIRLLDAINKKTEEINNKCSNFINDGVDYNEEHFSYTLPDQNNIFNSIQLARLTGYSIPYHADGKSCKLYTLEDMENIYMLQEMNLTKHTTYANQLKLYVKSLSKVDEVENVFYGQDLIDEYLDTYNFIMEHSQNVAKSVGGNDDE